MWILINDVSLKFKKFLLDLGIGHNPVEWVDSFVTFYPEEVVF